MADMNVVRIAVEWLAHEAMLFAAIGFAIGGLDDLLVDLSYAWLLVQRALSPRDKRDPVPGHLTTTQAISPIAVFVAAWDEASVIGAMLRNALTSYDYPDYRIYVGVYPNDPATIDAAGSVAKEDARIRLVIGGQDGPTTKADCLNRLWTVLLRDEVSEGRQVAAIMLHDAEDVVHPGELRVVADQMRDADVVQLPVVPLVDPQSRLISGQHQAKAEISGFCRFGMENRAKRNQILTARGKTAQPIRLAA